MSRDACCQGFLHFQLFGDENAQGLQQAGVALVLSASKVLLNNNKVVLACSFSSFIAAVQLLTHNKVITHISSPASSLDDGLLGRFRIMVSLDLQR